MEKDLLKILEDRFNKNPHRHEGISWDEVKNYFDSNKDALEKIKLMEESGGEPDLIHLSENNETFYANMSMESPKNRRSICYDKEARLNRKKNPPETSAEELADEIGVKIINKETYLEIQKLEDIDLKTSTWLETPTSIREKGGAIFGDKRYGETFIYHNGADSYYGSRGVRFILDLLNFR